MSKSTVAVVGAGLSGLVCANILSNNSFTVTVFDKGRHTGGRLASRDRDAYAFDYGAQYFTARDSRFRQFLAPLVRRETVARWNGRFGKIENQRLREEAQHEPRYVGVPLMRSLAEDLASSLDCQTLHRLTAVSRHANRWLLTGTSEHSGEQHSLGDYDFMVLNMPPAQAASLQPHPGLCQIIMRPCIALLLAFPTRLALDFDGIRLDDEVISWIARDSSKPGRNEGERWVIHASADWSEKHFLTEIAEVEEFLLHRFATIFNIIIPPIDFAKSHKWRFALPVSPPSIGCIFEPALALAYCGDWCVGARVEGAFLSGLSAAERIISAKT